MTRASIILIGCLAVAEATAYAHDVLADLHDRRMLLVGSVFIVIKQLRIRQWGANLRMAIAAVIVFWTFVEVIARNRLLNEIWIFPLSHLPEITILCIALVGLIFFSTHLRVAE